MRFDDSRPLKFNISSRQWGDVVDFLVMPENKTSRDPFHISTVVFPDCPVYGMGLLNLSATSRTVSSRPNKTHRIHIFSSRFRSCRRTVWYDLLRTMCAGVDHSKYYSQISTFTHRSCTTIVFWAWPSKRKSVGLSIGGLFYLTMSIMKYFY